MKNLSEYPRSSCDKHKFQYVGYFCPKCLMEQMNKIDILNIQFEEYKKEQKENITSVMVEIIKLQRDLENIEDRLR